MYQVLREEKVSVLSTLPALKQDERAELERIISYSEGVLKALLAGEECPPMLQAYCTSRLEVQNRLRIKLHLIGILEESC